VSAESPSNISTNPSEVMSEGARGWGSEFNFFSQNFYHFFLGAHAKMLNPTTTPSVVLNNGGKKNNKKKINICKIVAT
jgi:hypothetical protein